MSQKENEIVTAQCGDVKVTAESADNVVRVEKFILGEWVEELWVAGAHMCHVKQDLEDVMTDREIEKVIDDVETVIDGELEQ